MNESTYNRKTNNILKDDDLYKIIADDGDVQTAVKKLVMMVLESAMETMESGVGPSHAALMRSMLPSIIRAMAKEDETVHDELAEMRREMHEMMEQAMGSTTNGSG